MASGKPVLDNESARKLWIKETLSRLGPGSRLLDAGAGELANKAFCGHLDYVSQDFCQYDGKGNSNGLQTGVWDTSRIDIVSDITEIPEPDNSFDAVLCTEVLEHVPNPVPALRELCRLVKPGGKLILTAPFCSLTHFAPYHYSSGFNRYFYEHHLELAGFDIEVLESNGNYYSFLAQEVGRVSGMASSHLGLVSRFLLKALVRGMLYFLYKAGKHDHESHEMLCFGYHVVARKK